MRIFVCQSVGAKFDGWLMRLRSVLPRTFSCYLRGTGRAPELPCTPSALCRLEALAEPFEKHQNTNAAVTTAVAIRKAMKMFCVESNDIQPSPFGHQIAVIGSVQRLSSAAISAG